MRILVINQHFHPEVASSGQILTELCEDLVKAGHWVTVVTGMPSYRGKDESVPNDAELDRSEKRSLPVGRRLNWLLKILPRWALEWSMVFGVEVVRVYVYAPLLREGFWRYVQRMAQYLSFFAFSLPISLALRPHDVVLYLSTPPLLNGITASALRIFKGTPTVFNIQDLYPDVAIHLGVLQNRAIIGFCHFIEKFLYSAAERIVPIGSLMERNISEKGVPASKIVVIPNWTDTKRIRPMGKNSKFSRENCLGDKFVVMYSGNIGLSQGLENVIRAAELTRDLKDVLYLFIGGGASLDALKRMVEEMELDNVRFLPYQPKERLSESLSAADIHLLTLKKGLSKFSVPSKIYGILASARPLIASVDLESEISTMVNESRCGVVIAPESPTALAEAVRSLYNDREKLDFLGNNGRIYLENHVTRSICVGRYLSVFSQIGPS